MKRAEKMEFEEAEVLKQRWIALNNFAAKSEIVSHTITDVDVFTIIDDEENTLHSSITSMLRTELSTKVSPTNTSANWMKPTKNCSTKLF